MTLQSYAIIVKYSALLGMTAEVFDNGDRRNSSTISRTVVFSQNLYCCSCLLWRTVILDWCELALPLCRAFSFVETYIYRQKELYHVRFNVLCHMRLS